jgi:hypothetical protein
LSAACSPLNFSTALGALTINGVLMHRGAWDCVDVLELWEAADQRGSDRIISGVNGVIPFPRRPTVTKHSLPMVISGAVDQAGTPNTDPIIGLEANIDYLEANVVNGSVAADGTVAASIVKPSGATRTANIHVLALRLGKRVRWNLLATLDISIPTGVFV